MPATTRTQLTVDEFLAVTDADPRRMELIDGEIVVVNEPRFAHARIQARLVHAVMDWELRVPGRAQVAGPTGVHLTPHDAYRPDLLVVAFEPRRDARDKLAELPLICVEIRSPSTWRHDIGRKKSVYEEQGVPELWLVDDVARAVVFRRSAEGVASYDVTLELTVDDALESPLLPGFSLAVSELFDL